MKSRDPNSTEGKSGKRLLKLFGLVIGLFILMCAAQMLHEELSVPQWAKDKRAAVAIADNDPEAAAVLYEKAASAVPESGRNWEFNELLMQYGEFFWHINQFQDALPIFHRGVEFAHNSKEVLWEAAFLYRITNCEHFLCEQGVLDTSDPTYAERALQMRPGTVNKPDDYRASANEALGNSYADKGDYSRSNIFLEKSLAEFKLLKNEGAVRDILIDMIVSLVRQKKDKEATALTIQAMKQYPNQAYHLRTSYRRALKRRELAAFGMFPRVRRLFAANKFEQLDQYAQNLLTTQAARENGTWYLDSFQGEIDTLQDMQLEAKWQKHISKLKQWVHERPSSPFAGSVLVSVLGSYAWKARGTGWASSITSEGAKQMHERFAEGKQILEQQKVRTPLWYSAAFGQKLGQGGDAADYDKIMAECKKKFPTYRQPIFEKTYWLQPRWYGQEGQAEKYMNDEANKLPGSEGDILYAQSAWWLDYGPLGNVLTETKISWPRTKAGLIALIKKHPQEPAARAALAIMALEVDDTAASDSAFSI